MPGLPPDPALAALQVPLAASHADRSRTTIIGLATVHSFLEQPRREAIPLEQLRVAARDAREA